MIGYLFGLNGFFGRMAIHLFGLMVEYEFIFIRSSGLDVQTQLAHNW